MHEIQQRLRGVGENNWMRRSAGVRRVDRNNVDDIKDDSELCVQTCLMRRLTKSRSKGIGDAETSRVAYHQWDRRRGRRREGSPQAVELCQRGCQQGRDGWGELVVDAQERGHWRKDVEETTLRGDHSKPVPKQRREGRDCDPNPCTNTTSHYNGNVS